MAFIDYVEWPNMDSSLFAYKSSEHNLSTGTQVIVHESQEAVLFSKGEIVAEFGPGKHTLSSENLPLIRKLYGIPFGGNNPFTMDVWFVNKRAPLNIDWKISRIMVSDPNFKYVPIVAAGRYGLRVENSSRFLTELVGNVETFSKNQITEHFSGMIEQYTKNAIVEYLKDNNIAVTEASASLSEIANAVAIQMRPFWANYGLSIPNFFITSIEIDSSDQMGKSILDAIASSSAQSIAGYTWQQKEAMEVAKSALSGPGGDMGILGMAMLTGAFRGSSFSDSLLNVPPSETKKEEEKKSAKKAKRKYVYCSHCGKKYPSSSKFCPECGDKYNPCPLCGADNDKSAKRCVSCGASLLSSEDLELYACPSCGRVAESGEKFCPDCGTKLS